MNFEVTCFKIGSKNCSLKIYDIFLNSKYFFNQNISQDSKILGNFCGALFFEKVFSNLVKLQKNEKDTKIGK